MTLGTREIFTDIFPSREFKKCFLRVLLKTSLEAVDLSSWSGKSFHILVKLINGLLYIGWSRNFWNIWFRISCEKCIVKNTLRNKMTNCQNYRKFGKKNEISKFRDHHFPWLLPDSYIFSVSNIEFLELCTVQTVYVNKLTGFEHSFQALLAHFPYRNKHYVLPLYWCKFPTLFFSISVL
jgi:hypothetical protein